MSLPSHNQLEEWWLRELDRHIEGEQPRHNGKISNQLTYSERKALSELDSFLANRSDFIKWLNYSDGFGKSIYDDLKHQTTDLVEEKDGNYFYEKFKQFKTHKENEEIENKINFERLKHEVENAKMEFWQYVEQQRYEQRI
jgi:hypothetical protein